MKLTTTLIVTVLMMFICITGPYAGDLEPTSLRDATMDGLTQVANPMQEIYTLIQDINNKVTPVPCTGAAVAKTGQTLSYAIGDDGHHKKGAAHQGPRFTDNEDGTVTDNLTGLIWLKDAGALGYGTWSDALTQVANLNSGTDFLAAGYTPGTYSDWRLPNLFELESLRNMAYVNPCISNAAGTAKWYWNDPFVDALSLYYWSGTTYAHYTGHAWVVGMANGVVNTTTKTNNYYVWPVRDGND